MHELVLCQVLGPDRGVFLNILSVSCPLDGSYACYTCCYRLRVCLGGRAVDGDGPSTFIPGSAFS